MLGRVMTGRKFSVVASAERLPLRTRVNRSSKTKSDFSPVIDHRTGSAPRQELQANMVKTADGVM